MSEGQAAPAELSADRRALLTLLAQRQRNGIPRADRTTDLLASYAQQRLWFIDRLQPGNPAYNCPIAIRLRGPLDIAALDAAINELVRRHEVLRTTFSMAGTEVLQHIRPSVRIELPITDLTELSEPEQQAAVTEAVVADAHQPFDLVRGPVIRTRLLRLAEQHHVLLYDIHHIANDGWSVGVFFTELAELYNARLAGRNPQLPELSVQYADYAMWQRARITGRLREEQLAYWRDELTGLAPLSLPTDRPRPATLSPYGGVAHLPLPADLVAGLREIGRAEGATLFVTLMAALHVLLMRYSGETDIGVGTAYTDRDRAELQNLIGFFPNTVVIRADLAGAPGFRSVLRAVRKTTRGAFEHGDLPFDVLVGELAPRRDSSRNPFFDVFFTLDETAESPPRFTGLAAESIVPDFLTAKFDLGFTVRIDGDNPAVHCIYSSDLYELSTITALLEHYRTLLESILADPDRPITQLDLLPEPEWRRILLEFNDTYRRLPADECLHQPVIRRAAEQPDWPAVICGQRVVTYRELVDSAGRLARRLNRRGVSVGDIVGVCLPRGPERIVAMLAVMMSGAAYLPLDPDYPPERLGFLLTDSRSWGVLTVPELADRLAGGDSRLITLTELAADPDSDQPVEVPAPTPDDLAYVIYTSGSTGAPKGIALRHRGALNNFTDFNERFEIGPGDAVLGVSSPSFDMSMYDSVGMLGAGGTLVLPESDDSRDPARWIELITEHQITVWHSAPALLTLVLDRLDGTRGGLDSLRLALLGGDWIPVSMPDRLRGQAPRVRCIALGGATEASMDSTLYEVTQTNPDWTSIPYGRPMANQRCYVLDANRQPVPPGVAGELYLAGAGLAREYLHRPELTAERFVEHTFAPGFTERLYRTGDSVRLGRDGVLELLGRVDFQVKVHGLRIEPGEIESVLRRHPAVAAAVVVARGERGDTSLAGYYTRVAGQPAPAAEELRDWVGQSLPSFMVPAAFVELAELPTTPNGKVDRAGLRSLRVSTASSTGEPPRDELESRIAEIWRSALQLDQLSIDDNFFAVGGDSFTAIRVMHSLDADLPVVELFTHPSVRALAGRLRERGEVTEQLLYQLTPPDRPALVSLICVPYGGGNAIAYQPLADQLPADWALWSVALPGHDPGAGEQRFAELADTARRCAEEVLDRINGPLVVYGQCAGSATAVRLAQELERGGGDVRAVYVGAALPDPDPESSLRLDAETTDEQVHSYLAALGGFDGMLDDSDLQAILRAVRHDLRQASGFFLDARRNPPQSLEAALHCVFGSADPATEGFDRRYREWGAFGELAGLHVIEGGNHYFVRNDADELARLLQASYFEPIDDADFFATATSSGGLSR